MVRRALQGLPGIIGGTPLIELKQIAPEFRSRVLVKMERFNPGGSIKDRTALSMLLGAIEAGELDPERSVVIESSSGNLGVGLAQICRYFGLRFICVIDAKTTSRNLELLRAYRAEVELVTEPDADSGEYLPARLRRVRELVAATPHAYWPNQYANPNNPRAHQQTMREIHLALDGRIDYLFASVGTFGTMRGCAEYIREHRLNTRIIGVDAIGSVIFDQPPAPRLLPGHGASIRPPLTDTSLVDEVIHVSDLDSVVGCRKLVQREAILAGGSSGAVTAAFLGYRDRIPDGSNCVLIYPDGGDRYLDTIYHDGWVLEKFGDISGLWQETAHQPAPVAG